MTILSYQFRSQRYQYHYSHFDVQLTKQLPVEVVENFILIFVDEKLDMGETTCFPSDFGYMLVSAHILMQNLIFRPNMLWVYDVYMKWSSEKK